MASEVPSNRGARRADFPPSEAAKAGSNHLGNPARRWARRKASRPGELLAAAHQIFVERGFAAARLGDVAARARVSKGTLYLYFDNKEELFKAVVRNALLPLIDDFHSAIDDSSLSSAELLERFLDAWWAQYGATSLAGVCKLCVAESGNFPEVAQFWRDEVISAHHALVAQILQRGIDRGEFRPVDVDAMVHLVMAPLLLHVLMRDSLDDPCAGSVPLEPQRVIGSHLDVLRHALVAEAPCAAAARFPTTCRA